MLEPLKEFICDECGQIINSPDEGYVEWIENEDADGKPVVKGFRIIHNSACSPFKEKGREGCFKYAHTPGRCDIDLEYFLSNAPQYLTSFLDLGFLHDPVGVVGSRIKDYKEFTNFARRLLIPYYEEARTHFSEVLADGEFCDNHEINIFTEDTLKQIINRFA